MTEVSRAPLTHRRVLKTAFPIVLSNATVPIIGLVDTGVVGQLGQAAPIGAVAVGAVVLTSVYWLFGFLRMGTTGLVSQAHGAGDGDEVAALLSRALIFAFGFGGLIIILQLPLFWAAFHLSPASAEVEMLAREYMRIRILSAPAAIAIYAMTGWLIALERTRSVLVIQIAMNGLNVVLDLWFVLGLNWGVEGVALATFIAEWSGAALGLWLCRAAFRGDAWRRVSLVFAQARLGRMLSVNTDILLRSLALMAIIVSFTFLGAGFGDVTLAANQVLMLFLNITAHALDGFAFTAETFIGQALGAGARAELRRGVILTSIWGLASVAALALAFGLFGGDIIDIMTTSAEVRVEARGYLVYMVLAPLIGVAAWMLDGIFIGATRSRDMRNMMLLSLLIYAASLLILLPLFGNHGLWLALLVSYAARGATLAAKYPGLEAAADG
ncbi:MAG: MATE family efflux transporter [Rhodobacteraceae bacterium]|nr:MATE family efflux transporter [Paracoccaceae bacterium]